MIRGALTWARPWTEVSQDQSSLAVPSTCNVLPTNNCMARFLPSLRYLIKAHLLREAFLRSPFLKQNTPTCCHVISPQSTDLDVMLHLY